jgi:hypothetical protein
VSAAGRHLRALGGVAGPLTFIAAWSILGTAREGYSPVAEPISRLAAIGSPDRVAMSGGLLAFGLGVGAYAMELRTAVPGSAALAAGTAAVATAGLAATPLGGALGGRPHAAFAAAAYAGLAATPVLAGRYLGAQGRRGASTASVAVGVTAGGCLLASALAPRAVGLLQRAGLTLGDSWIIASAIWLGRGSWAAGPLRGDQNEGSGPR